MTGDIAGDWRSKRIKAAHAQPHLDWSVLHARLHRLFADQRTCGFVSFGVYAMHTWHKSIDRMPAHDGYC